MALAHNIKSQTSFKYNASINIYIIKSICMTLSTYIQISTPLHTKTCEDSPTHPPKSKLFCFSNIVIINELMIGPRLC